MQWYAERSGRGGYSNISKVCYLRCKKKIVSLKVKIDRCQGTTGLGLDYPPWPAFN